MFGSLRMGMCCNAAGPFAQGEAKKRRAFFDNAALLASYGREHSSLSPTRLYNYPASRITCQCLQDNRVIYMGQKRRKHG